MFYMNQESGREECVNCIADACLRWDDLVFMGADDGEDGGCPLQEVALLPFPSAAREAGIRPRVPPQAGGVSSKGPVLLPTHPDEEEGRRGVMRALLEKGNTQAAQQASREEGLGFAFEIPKVCWE